MKTGRRCPIFFILFHESRNSLFAALKYVFFTKSDKYFIKNLNYMFPTLDELSLYSVKYICISWGTLPFTDTNHL